MIQYNKFQEVSSRTLKVGITLLVSIVTIGIIGFHFIEELSLLDSAYMTIITISTVG